METIVADDISWPPDLGAFIEAFDGSFEAGKWWTPAPGLVQDFAAAFAAAHDAAYGIPVCNGTVALDVVLRALQVGSGDKVVLPAYDFYSHARSVSNVGATPCFADVRADNLTIGVENLENMDLRGVRAVVASHISGSVAELDRLCEFCEEAGIVLIEDCAQAHGASYGGRHVGSWGQVALFSFGRSKLMTSGQGGMILTSDPELRERCHAIVHRGYDSRGKLNPFAIIGENYQMSELAVVVLKPQLKSLQELAVRREQTIAQLDQIVSSLGPFCAFKQFAKTTCRSHFAYSFFYPHTDLQPLNRDNLIAEARRRNIPLDRGYKTVMHEPKLFGAYPAGASLPVAEEAERTVISIHHVHLLKGADFWKTALSSLCQAM